MDLPLSNGATPLSNQSRPSFKKGDVVRLETGGERMTVLRPKLSGADDPSGERSSVASASHDDLIQGYVCFWNGPNGTIKTETFSPENLILLERDDQCSPIRPGLGGNG
jgi:uncharacterized protein YodC (DUF2158 family)